MWPCSVSQHTNANIKTYKYKDVEIQMRKYRNTKSIAGQSALVGVDDGKDWTWNAALAQGSADLIQGLGLQHRGVGTLYKGVYRGAQGCRDLIQGWRTIYTILHPRGLGSDGQMRNRRRIGIPTKRF